MRTLNPFRTPGSTWHAGCRDGGDDFNVPARWIPGEPAIQKNCLILQWGWQNRVFLQLRWLPIA
jgi:hypothetical protein